MRVRLLTGRATETESWEPGEEIDVPDDEAKRLLENGSAEPVARKPADKRETRSAE